MDPGHRFGRVATDLADGEMKKMRREPPQKPTKTTKKNNVEQVKLIEKLQKAIMIVRMCRPLVLAASKHHKSCGALCLHWVDLSLPSGSWLGPLCPPRC